MHGKGEHNCADRTTALVSPSGSGEANGNVGDNELADCGDEEVAIELTSDKRDKEPL